jgi:predicted aspartyl protease
MRTMTESGGISRRRLLGCAAASFFLPQTASAREALAPVEAPSSIAASRDASDRLTIGVSIDGKSPLRFFVDTGADRSVISAEAANTLKLQRSRTVLVEGVVRTVPAETVLVRKMRFGAVTCENLALPELPRKWLEADGILGLDAIDGSCVTFDFLHQALLVEMPQRVWHAWAARPDERTIPAKGLHGHLRSLDCRIDGVSATAFIDTGASDTIGNSALFAALSKTSGDYALSSQTVILSGATGGTIAGRTANIGMIRFPGLRFNNGQIVIADLQIFKLWELADKPALLIGMDFLRQFNRVVIDYRVKEFRFDVAEHYVTRNG